MVSIILIIENVREEQILKMAFEQLGLKVLLSKPTYQNYLVTLQFVPDIILIELPYVCVDHLTFVKRIRSFKKTSKVPVISYGDKVDTMVKRGMERYGVNFYVERPLKFTDLIKLISRVLKPFNKTVEIKSVLSDKEKDIELILNSDSLPSQKIDAMIRHMSSLLAFPFTVAKVLHITQDPKSGAAHLASAITADPTMIAHILKVANSVFFASSNRRISSVKDAIVRIGFLETKKIAMSMWVMDLFDKRNKSSGFDRIGFWYHSLLTGIIAEQVAKHMGDVNRDEAFLTGLLHDLGEILLDEYLPQVFDKTLLETSQKGGHYPECQIKQIGVNHIDMIVGLFPLWKLPSNITEAISNLQKKEETIDSPGKKISLCVKIGNILSKSLHIGKECDEFVMPLSNTMFINAGMRSGIKKEFLSKIENDINVFCNFMNLEKRDFGISIPNIDNPSDFTIGILNAAKSVFIPFEIYLTKSGFNTVQFTTDTIDTANGSSNYNLILVICGQDFEKDDVLSLNDKLQKSIPVPFLFSGSEELISQIDEKFNCISERIDLRLFGQKIGELLSKNLKQPD